MHFILVQNNFFLFWQKRFNEDNLFNNSNDAIKEENEILRQRLEKSQNDLKLLRNQKNELERLVSKSQHTEMTKYVPEQSTKKKITLEDSNKLPQVNYFFIKIRI